MLTGEEKIKGIHKDDICNYLNISLCSFGVIGVHIETVKPLIKASVKGSFSSYDVLFVYFNTGSFCRIAFNCPRVLNSTLNEIRNIILKNIELSLSTSKTELIEIKHRGK